MHPFSDLLHRSSQPFVNTDSHIDINDKRVFVLLENQVANVRPECTNGEVLSTLLNSTSSTRRYAYLDCMFNIHDDHPLRISIMRNIVTNNFGAIVNPTDCTLLRNGGCYFMHHGKIYQFHEHGSPHVHDLVISLGSGASGTWHFPMESVVSLAYLDMSLLKQAYFLVPTKSAYILEWLTVLGISRQQVIEDKTVHARTLLVPEMGRCSVLRCDPFNQQLEWFVSTYKALANIANHAEYSLRTKEGTTKLAQHKGDNTKSSLRNGIRLLNNLLSPRLSNNISSIVNTIRDVYSRKILVIHRRHKRKVANYDSVKQSVMSYAAENNMIVDIHDDGALPSLLDQIRQFSTADIILAPHGAALLFSIFAPAHACVIEFLNGGDPYCYSRLAYTRGLSYVSYAFQDANGMLIQDVLDGLATCSRAIY